ncbi:hypothetical protein WUBG_02775 [Wuchereria bancrofti]|uniref:Uncharacterized protein n=1 Tax=Wuchereria bancrofti TaxID=6293 RepID=J9EUP6_WUCBA|nr:hypothetical protein WUBG_02775 [Wuchereria bancrofti]VDM19422.1 unnamed protein product [Wuchereria bancrofti]
MSLDSLDSRINESIDKGRRYGKSTFRVVAGQQSSRELSRSVLHFGSISCEALANGSKTLKLSEFQLKVSSMCCSEITTRQRKDKQPLCSLKSVVDNL